MKNKRLITSATAAVLILLMASIASAVPGAVLLYNETDLGGSWQYNYTLHNTSTEGEALHEVYVYFSHDVTVTGTSLPAGWDGLPWTGTYAISYLNAYSTDFTYDIITGDALGGFSFIVDYRAGNIFYVAYFSGDKQISGTTAVCLFPFYRDIDGDGYGNPEDTVQACLAPEGYVADNTDCDDGLASINPLTLWYRDYDGDGYGYPAVYLQQCTAPEGYVADNTDCDDSSASINPLTLWYRDYDGDGYGYPAVYLQQCTAPEGYIADNTDCDDTNQSIHPDTLWHPDLDGDGYGNSTISVQQCLQPSGPMDYVLNAIDYDDNNSSIGPPARINRGTSIYYLSLQEAYNTAADGDTIQCVNVTFTENITINGDKSVTLEGGYDGLYSTITGITTLQGDINVTGGTLNIENFELLQ